MSDEKWMQKYVYTKLHEIFFCEFPIILTKWLKRLVENTRRYRTAAPKNWTPDLARNLNYVSNQTSCAMYFWLDSILGGYTT